MRHSELVGALIEDAVAQGVTVRFRAEGISMYPSIRDGETISVAPVSSGAVAIGDVLLYLQGTRLLAHRVVAISGQRGDRVFVLQGDAKASPDQPVDARALLGRVVSVERGGRSISLRGHRAEVRRRLRAAASQARTFCARVFSPRGARPQQDQPLRERPSLPSAVDGLRLS